MKFEGIPEQINNEPENKRDGSIPTEDVFRARNEMQIKLATRFYGFEIEDEQFGKWIDEYSIKFADILKDHPEFLDKYVHGETGEVVEGIAELLYDKHEVNK